MCSTKWKCLWERFIYSLTLVCLVLSLLNPIPTYAAPPPPESPAPPVQPFGAKSAKVTLSALPTPDAPQFEEARAKAAIEAIIQKTLDAWGPRYQASPVEVSVDGDWAFGIAQWKGNQKSLKARLTYLPVVNRMVPGWR